MNNVEERNVKRSPTSGDVEVRHLTSCIWILVTPRRLDARATRQLRDACLDGLDRGVPQMVVDLTGVTEICSDGLDVLENVARVLAATGGSLWLASEEPGAELEIREIGASGLGGAGDLNGALAASIAARIATDYPAFHSESVRQ